MEYYRLQDGGFASSFIRKPDKKRSDGDEIDPGKGKVEVIGWGGVHEGEGHEWAVAVAEALRALSESDMLLSKGEPGGAHGAATDGLKIASERLGTLHIMRMRLLNALMKASMELGRWREALDAARTLLPHYEAAYQGTPPAGLHVAIIAKLEVTREPLSLISL